MGVLLRKLSDLDFVVLKLYWVMQKWKLLCTWFSLLKFWISKLNAPNQDHPVPQDLQFEVKLLGLFCTPIVFYNDKYCKLTTKDMMSALCKEYGYPKKSIKEWNDLAG